MIHELKGVVCVFLVVVYCVRTRVAKSRSETIEILHALS